MLGALKWCDYTYDTVEILNTKTVEHQPYILYLLTFIYQQIHLVVTDAIRRICHSHLHHIENWEMQQK